MAILGSILLGLLAFLLVLVIVLVATPMHFGLRAEFGETDRIIVEVRSLWGLTPRLRVVDSARSRRGRAAKPPKKRKPGSKKWRFGAARAEHLLRRLPQTVRGVLARIHVDRMRVDADFGTGDPASTGRIYGYLTPLIYVPKRRGLHVAVRPDFNRARLQGRADLALHLTPAALAFPIIKLAWTVFVRWR